MCTRGDTGVINETREHAREERERRSGWGVWRECTKPPRIDFPSRIWGRTTVLRANVEPKDSSWEGVESETKLA